LHNIFVHESDPVANVDMWLAVCTLPPEVRKVLVCILFSSRRSFKLTYTSTPYSIVNMVALPRNARSG
jgi:hypothetical protein